MTEKFIQILPLSIIIVFSSCSETEHDCICTEEYRMITAVVVDENKTPIEGLETEVRDKRGKVFDFHDEDPFFPGSYVVMTDRYTDDFSTSPEEIFFTVRWNNTKQQAVYLISTDECSCHVNKISGPDTLVLR